MPKRKGNDKYDRLMRKLKKIEKKIRKKGVSNSDSESENIPPSSSSAGENTAATPPLLVEEWTDLHTEELPEVIEPQVDLTNTDTVQTQGEQDVICDELNEQLDLDILEILGEDPSSDVKYGSEIRKELACRLQHITTAGLTKECRKELLGKYLIPANCTHIDAPKLNPEIKAAIPESSFKRDKGIELKQKQMAAVISGLGQIINTQLNSKDKNNDTLQKLMDISRLLCDLQHADSVTRRNFICFGLKKDMKDHLTTTKVDSFLFGENLAETLKSAKAVNKSGIELKADINKSNKKLKPIPFPKHLNRKAPPQNRRLVGMAPVPRSREPATARMQHQPPPVAHSSKTSYTPHPNQTRRRY
ncbi:hypothetical protein ACJJTC_004743 [Scirpophaga incertulas]